MNICLVKNQFLIQKVVIVLENQNSKTENVSILADGKDKKNRRLKKQNAEYPFSREQVRSSESQSLEIPDCQSKNELVIADGKFSTKDISINQNKEIMETE